MRPGVGDALTRGSETLPLSTEEVFAPFHRFVPIGESPILVPGGFTWPFDRTPLSMTVLKAEAQRRYAMRN
jgi:hypothetical protein